MSTDHPRNVWPLSEAPGITPTADIVGHPDIPATVQGRIASALDYRRQEAEEAAKRAVARTVAAGGVLHRPNGDEALLANAHRAMSFTKGLAHDPATGLADTEAAEALRSAIDGGEITPFTTEVDRPMPAGGRRQWEAPTAGFVHELQGPDPQAVTMAPAPALNTVDGTFDELAFEMAEVYELALLRDVPFGAFQAGASEPRITLALARFNALPYAAAGLPATPPAFGGAGSPRPRMSQDGALTAQTVFRGSALGAADGPYLSQFMLMGSFEGLNTPPEDQGQIAFGNQRIDQRVRKATEQDWMIDWDSWLAVQNGGRARSDDTLFESGRRFIHTPRDLATYVHDDALYQAYLNACLLLLGMGAPFDPGFARLAGGPVPDPDGPAGARLDNAATGFALFGGPHILSLVTEVATRGLKAVRYQKFQNHLRLRPETLAGRLARASEIEALPKIVEIPEISGQFAAMAAQLAPVMSAVRAHNMGMGGQDLPLLPMAFQEGSPMHPAYGAGHATVAGACVTVLKAFFDTTAQLTLHEGRIAFRKCENGVAPGIPVQMVSVDDGARLEVQIVDAPLTLLGELNKLAANISIGRNMAGVHFFSDYYDSARMGEEIAVGILEEQSFGYPEDPFGLSLVPFNATDPAQALQIVRGTRLTAAQLHDPAAAV